MRTRTAGYRWRCDITPRNVGTRTSKHYSQVQVGKLSHLAGGLPFVYNPFCLSFASFNTFWLHEANFAGQA